MHEVPAHRTASLITSKIVATLQVDVVVLRLLTPFFILSPQHKLVVVAVNLRRHQACP